MKTIILLTVLTLTGCGVAESLRESCGSDIEMGCNAVFGYKNKDQDLEIDNLKKKNTEQDAKIADLQNQINNNLTFANSLQADLQDLTNQINDTNSDITSLQNSLVTQINNVQANVNTLMVQMLTVNNTLPVLQSNVTNLQNAVTSLNATVSQSVIGMVDSCGDGPGLDEVLLKTKDGKYVAYFEQGGNRFLSVLQVGSSYQTTDSQHCNFTVTASGITW